MQALARVRTAISNKPSMAAVFDSFRKAHRGLDPYGVMLYSMLPFAIELGCHTQGCV